MRVAVASRSLSLNGGIERYTAEVVAALARDGHAISVVTSHVEMAPPVGVDVVTLRPPPAPAPIQVLVELATFGPRASRAMARLAGDPLRYRPLGFADGPGVVTAHSCHAAWLADRARTTGEDRPNLLDRALLAQERRTFADPDVVATTVSRRCAEEIRHHYGTAIPESHIVRPAVDGATFPVRTQEERRRARARFGLQEGDLVVGAVANHSFRRKRVEPAIHACGHLGATLLVAGTVGRDGKDVVARARQLGAEVRFLGNIDDVPAFYAALDAFVLPSVNEAYGMAAHEAMARGVPTLVSDRCGIADFLDAGTHALVVPDSDCDDPTRLATRIDELRRPEVGQPMAAAGAEWAHGRTWEAVGDELAAVLRQASSDR